MHIYVIRYFFIFFYLYFCVTLIDPVNFTKSIMPDVIGSKKSICSLSVDFEKKAIKKFFSLANHCRHAGISKIRLYRHVL